MVHLLTVRRVSSRPPRLNLREIRLVVRRSLVPVKPMLAQQLLDQRSSTQHSQRAGFACLGLNEHALLALKHLTYCRTLEHPILVRGVTLKLAHRQPATQAPAIEDQRVRIAN